MTEEMKVKTKITFEFEYPMCLDFYVPSSKEASLEMERKYVNENPITVAELFIDDAKVTTSVERI